MSKLFANKKFIAFLFFILGALTFWRIEHSFVGKFVYSLSSPHHSMFKMDLLNPFKDHKTEIESDDPFLQMQKEMFKHFSQGGSNFFGDNSLLDQEITSSEDDNFFYYEIDLHGQQAKKLEVEVKNGQLTISGELENKKDNGNSSYLSTSQFNRSFPVPEGVDEQNYKLEQKDDKIIVKFPKTTSL